MALGYIDHSNDHENILVPSMLEFSRGLAYGLSHCTLMVLCFNLFIILWVRNHGIFNQYHSFNLRKCCLWLLSKWKLLKVLFCPGFNTRTLCLVLSIKRMYSNCSFHKMYRISYQDQPSTYLWHFGHLQAGKVMPSI